MAAPRRTSARAPRSASFATEMASEVPSANPRRSPSGMSRQPRFGATETRPSLRRTTPAMATPTPIRRSSAGRSERTDSARLTRSTTTSSTDEWPRGRSTRTASKTTPPSPTAAAASESTATSSASATAAPGTRRTMGEGRPGCRRRAGGISHTSPAMASSPTCPRIELRVRLVRVTSSDRDRGPLRCSSRTIVLRFARRTDSLRWPMSMAGIVRSLCSFWPKGLC